MRRVLLPIRTAIVLAEINERMPRTHGHTAIPLSQA